MRIITTMTSMFASVVLAGFAVAASTSEVQVAASDDCRSRCQAAENQCRMKSKDLDSSRCNAAFLACIQSCRK